MKRLFGFGVVILAAILSACSPNESPEKSARADTGQMLETVIAQGKGFTVGAMMSANTVYVLFDPQCPHCGHLWNASEPLLKKTKFVWIPVAIINGKSAPQGAALLGAPNPTQAMQLHEASLLAGNGGTSTPGGLSAEMEATIKKNTELFTALRLESVPFLIGRNAETGLPVSNGGALDTVALAKLLGIAMGQ